MKIIIAKVIGLNLKICWKQYNYNVILLIMSLLYKSKGRGMFINLQLYKKSKNDMFNNINSS